MTYINWKYEGIITTIGEYPTRAAAEKRVKVSQEVIGVGWIYLSKNATVAWKIKSRVNR